MRKPRASASRIVALAAAIALGAGVAVLGMRAGVALAQNTGELSRGMLMEEGWWAGALAPIRFVDGRRVVMVSAPDSEWTVTFGPFMSPAECSSNLSEYSRGTVPTEVYERVKAGHAAPDDEARVLKDVQARNVKCIQSDGSERFRMPGNLTVDPTTDFVK